MMKITNATSACPQCGSPVCSCAVGLSAGNKHALRSAQEQHALQKISGDTGKSAQRDVSKEKDTVEISKQGKKLYNLDQRRLKEEAAEQAGAVDGEDEFSENEQKEIQELKQRDQEVRAHEQAHLAAAGGYATGGAKYSYEIGPDGKRYAVGGEVGIDTSAVEGNPRATLQKAATIRRAALAPAEPSGADRAVAAQAASMAAQARQEIMEENHEDNISGDQTGEGASISSGNTTGKSESAGGFATAPEGTAQDTTNKMVDIMA